MTTGLASTTKSRAAARLRMAGHVEGEDPDRLTELRGGQSDAAGRDTHGLHQVDRDGDDLRVVGVDRSRRP